MQWRRGLLLAVIHLAVAMPQIVLQGSGYWRTSGDPAIPDVARLRIAAWQEEQVVGFDPCHGGFVDRWVSPFEATISLIDFPAWKLSGIWEPCPARWSLAEILPSSSADSQFRKYLLVSGGFCSLLVAQWLFIGGLPLVHPKKWWSEPGTFITFCAVAAAVIALPYSFEMNVWASEGLFKSLTLLSTIPAVLALAAWVWWLGLLLWKPIRFFSRRASRRTIRNA
jgi:hypothetical protein